MDTLPLSEKPKPISLCLERLADGPLERFVKCTAKPGRGKGLAIGLDGSIRWCGSGPVGCEIWVARDQRLVALCPEGTPPTVLARAGRELELPRGKPVFVRNRDQLRHAGVRFRIHIHGLTTEVHAPQALRGLPGFAAAAAMAMAMGSSASGCALSSERELQDSRPIATAFPDGGSGRANDAGDAGMGRLPVAPLVGGFGYAGSGGWQYEPANGADVSDDAGEPDVIEIRNGPPE